LSGFGYGSADELKAKRKYPQSAQRLPDRNSTAHEFTEKLAKKTKSPFRPVGTGC